MMRDELYDQIEINDLTGDMRDIAEQCGLDVAIQIMKKFGGAQLSIPRTAHYGFARRFIQSHKNYHRNTLALMLDMSRTTVGSILSETEHV